MTEEIRLSNVLEDANRFRFTLEFLVDDNVVFTDTNLTINKISTDPEIEAVIAHSVKAFRDSIRLDPTLDEIETRIQAQVDKSRGRP